MSAPPATRRRQRRAPRNVPENPTRRDPDLLAVDGLGQATALLRAYGDPRAVGGTLPNYQRCEAEVWVGPGRLLTSGPDAATPVPNGSGDVSVPSGYTNVTGMISGISGAWEGHQQTVTLALHTWAARSDVFATDAWVIVRARWVDANGDWLPWAALVVGNVIGGGGTADGRARAKVASGDVRVAQEWFYYAKRPLPPLTYGLVDVARGRTATSSPILTTPAAENGIEYLSTSSVAADMAVDGNRDTVWVAQALADTVWTKPNWKTSIYIAEAFNGSPGAAIGTNGLPCFITLWCADGKLYESFESATGTWNQHYGGSYARTSAWANSGSWSLAVSLPNPEAGISREWTGLAPEIEAVVRFVARAATGTIALEALVTGTGSTHVETIRLSTTPHVYEIRHPVNRAGVLNLRFKSRQPGASVMYLDDLSIVGGVKCADTGQPYARLWLVWDDGLGGSNYADLQRAFDLETMAAESWVVLTDDVDLFKARFDPGPDAAVTQYREVPGLRDLDFASGRGRLRLAYYRRWPDLPGASGEEGLPWTDPSLAYRRWDDWKLNEQPAFALTSMLRRTSTAQTGVNSIEVKNPAPAGSDTVGVAWWEVNLGDYPYPTLAAAITAAAGASAQVSSTDGLPSAGYGWVESERVWYTITGPVSVRFDQRGVAGGGAAAAHAVGAPLRLDNAGTRVMSPLIAAVGIRRRPGTPILHDFTILGTALETAADPAVEVLGRSYENHPDWFPLATVRNNMQASPTYLLGAQPGDAVLIAWPPPPGTTYAAGREVRRIRIYPMRMQRWDGQPQRAKLNEVVAYAANPASGPAGGWRETAPADVRGIAANILTQYVGLPTTRLYLWRGEATGLPWGRHYGSLKTAAGSVGEVLEGLEAKGMLRVLCRPDGTVEIIPDPRTTAASMQLPDRTWTADQITSWRYAEADAHPCAQVRVVARNADTGEMFASAYPRTPTLYGEIIEAGDLILGDQTQVDIQAARVFRQANARGAAEVTTWRGPLPQIGRRHVVTYAAADSGGAIYAGTNMVVEGFQWTLTGLARRAQFELTVSLSELAPWS